MEDGVDLHIAILDIPYQILCNVFSTVRLLSWWSSSIIP
jgi:hypothetical protein